MKTLITSALISFGVLARALTATAENLTAQQIVEKLETKYSALTSLKVSGKSIADIDLSGGKNVTEMKWDLTPRPVTTFTVLLAQPDLYRVDWTQKVTEGYTNQGAAWSAGNGDFLLLAGKKQAVEGGREMALAGATGVSGGAANTLPTIFFKNQTNWLNKLANLKLLPEEKLNNEACYVISGDANGSRLMLWIGKDFSLKQKRQILRGETKMPEVTDEDVKKALKQFGQDASEEAVQRMKETMKSMQGTMKNTKGSLTEIYEKTELNPSLAREAFDYELGSKPPR